MNEIDIQYSNNTLHILLSGNVKNSTIKKLKQKLYYIIGEYGIDNIILDINNINDIDKNCFYDFLDDYDLNYGGNLELIGKV